MHRFRGPLPVRQIMTKRQSFALCRVLADPRNTEPLRTLAKTIINDAGRFGTILTVDLWKGELHWHVSVTPLSDQFKPMLWAQLKPSQREAIRQLARELLADVGRPESDLEDAQDERYRIIRQLTIEEERLTFRGLS